jgi:hypothetical protein
MANVIYPAPAPTIAGDYLTISTFLNSPTLLTRALRTLAEQRFISDALLTGRYVATGGAVRYEQNESIYTDKASGAVMPGGEYPMSSLGTGPSQMASVVKWGEDVPITDESIHRMNFDPVQRALTKLTNRIILDIDSITLAAIASQVTTVAPTTASWKTATAQQIFSDVAQARAQIYALKQGFMPDTIVVDDFSYARAFAAFIQAGYLPREQNNPVGDLQGGSAFPTINGLRWLASPNLPTPGTAIILDSTLLGGMADEQLGGPGYTGAVSGVETKSIRQDEIDGWRLRARRITVPIVREPLAAIKLLGIAA